MKKTSRRRFGKQLTGALVALPIASMSKGSVSAQEKDQTKPRATGVVDIRTSHDTPPPILIGEGSLILERKNEFQSGDVLPNSGRVEHHIRPFTSGMNRIYPAHIKVVDGSGEMLYRNDSAEKCVVTILANDGDGNSATVNARASALVGIKQTFIIDTDALKGFDKTNELKPDPLKKRNVRYRHKKQGSKEFSIVRVKITDLGDILYQVELSKLPSKGEDFRVMIWTDESV